MPEIAEEIKEALLARGASLVGIADLSEIPDENRPGMKTGIAIGETICGMCIYVCPWTKNYLRKHVAD